MQKTLIKNAFIITMDDQLREFRGDIMIERDVIRAVGVALDHEEAEIVDGYGMIVVPGFVNSHLHTWQTAIRGVASNWTLPEYLKWVHAGLAEKFSPRDVYLSTLAGALNQIDAGTTMLVDWCHNNPTPEHTDAALEALKEAGLRVMFMHGSPKPGQKSGGQRPFWEVPHPRYEIDRLTRALKSDRGLICLGMAILGPHYSTMEVAYHDFELACEFDLIASMHQGGGPARSANGWARLGKAGLLSGSVNIVHGNDLSDIELDLLVDSGASFTTTPESEMICGHGQPVFSRLRSRGVSPSLGSDIESALSGDMLTTARIALSYQRVLDNLIAKSNGGIGGTCSVDTRDALRWITRNGAQMTKQDNEIGSIEVGKQADLVMIAAGSLNLCPVLDPVSSVIMHANQSNVHSVMVAGNWKKRGGRLLHDRVSDLMAELSESGRRIVASLGIRPTDIHRARSA